MTGNKVQRIFVDAHVFDGEFQGTRSYLEGLYKAVAQQAQHIRLFIAANDADNLANVFKGYTANIEVLKYKSGSRISRLSIEIPTLVSKIRADFAHFQYLGPLIKNSRWIITVHDLLFLDYPELFPRVYRLSRTYPFKRSARLADVLCTDSEYSAKSISRHFAVPRQDIVTLPLGIDAKFFEPLDFVAARENIKQKYGIDNYVLCVSRLEPRKGQHLLIRWLRTVGDELGMPLACVLVGKQTIEYAAFHNEVAELKCTHKDPLGKGLKVIRIDQICDHDLPSLYAASRLVVYPSVAEGFGIPPLEAAALGVPVLCSNRTSMEDYSFFGHDHIDPLDTSTALRRLRALMLDDRDRQELDVRKRKIQSKYSWDKTAAIFISQLEKQLAR